MLAWQYGVGAHNKGYLQMWFSKAFWPPWCCIKPLPPLSDMANLHRSLRDLTLTPIPCSGGTSLPFLLTLYMFIKRWTEEVKERLSNNFGSTCTI